MEEGKGAENNWEEEKAEVIIKVLLVEVQQRMYLAKKENKQNEMEIIEFMEVGGI